MSGEPKYLPALEILNAALEALQPLERMDEPGLVIPHLVRDAVIHAANDLQRAFLALERLVETGVRPTEADLASPRA